MYIYIYHFNYHNEYKNRFRKYLEVNNKLFFDLCCIMVISISSAVTKCNMINIYADGSWIDAWTEENSVVNKQTCYSYSKKIQKIETLKPQFIQLRFYNYPIIHVIASGEKFKVISLLVPRTCFPKIILTHT